MTFHGLLKIKENHDVFKERPPSQHWFQKPVADCFSDWSL